MGQAPPTVLLGRALSLSEVLQQRAGGLGGGVVRIQPEPLQRGGNREWPEAEASKEEVAAMTLLQSDATQLACLQVECLKRCMEVLVCDGWRRGSRVAHLVDTIHSLSVGKGVCPRRGVW